MKEFIEKLIGRLEKNQEIYRGMADACKDILPRNFYFGKMYSFADAIEIVNELAEEYKGGWIPCSERLPEDDTKQYIVQKTNGFIDILGFTKDAYKLSRYDFYEYNGKKKQFFYGYDSEYGYIEYECVAWMPLPEKYKGE